MDSGLDHVIFRANIFMDVAFAMMGGASELFSYRPMRIQLAPNMRIHHQRFYGR